MPLLRTRPGLAGFGYWLCMAIASVASAQPAPARRPDACTRAAKSRPTPPHREVSETAPPAQQDAAAPTYETVVRTHRSPAIASELPASVSVVDGEALEGKPALSLGQALRTVPGVFAQNQNNFAQDLRLSIRGFGSRASFGIRGIKLIYDGIPLTLPDGQSQVDILDLASVERVEVLRGPASALYGNAAGGVIRISTPEPREGMRVQLRSTGGSLGLLSLGASARGRAGNVGFSAGVSRFQMRGFRERSRVVHGTARLKLDVRVSDDTQLRTLFHFVDAPVAQDPGGLTQQQRQADPGAAGPLYHRFETGESVTQGQVGWVIESRLANNHKLENTFFYTTRKFRGRIPFTVIRFDRDVLGGGLRYVWASPLGGAAHELTAGVDVQRQRDRRLNFASDAGDPVEPLDLHQDERVWELGSYLQESLELGARWRLVVGGRYDLIQFAVADRRLSDGDQSGRRVFHALSGQGGLLYAAARWANVYANAGQAFETPTTTELVNRPAGGGGLNRNLRPQRSLTAEGGLRGELLGGSLAYNLTGYWIRLRNQLVSYESEQGRNYFRNAGRSRRWGTSASARMQLRDGLRARLAYTWLRARFVDYVVEDEQLAGNQSAGIPRHRGAMSVTYSRERGVLAGATLDLVGSRYADDANTAVSPGYVLANLRLGYRGRLGTITYAAYAGVRNLLDSSYDHNLRINARSGRYFEPAPGRHYYAQLQMGWQARSPE